MYVNASHSRGWTQRQTQPPPDILCGHLSPQHVPKLPMSPGGRASPGRTTRHLATVSCYLLCTRCVQWGDQGNRRHRRYPKRAAGPSGSHEQCQCMHTHHTRPTEHMCPEGGV